MTIFDVPEFEWTTSLSSSPEFLGDSANAITIGSDGSIYIAGYTEGDLDGNQLKGTQDAFITKYNSNSYVQKVWTKTVGSSVDDWLTASLDDYFATNINSITTGSDGSIYIAR